MKPQEKPIHIVCDKEDIAPFVIMPGDPLRAKYIAEKFLTDYKLVNTVRNMFAYTGFYKGVRVTVAGSGMGMPSMSIYAFELFYYYNVSKIIRIGTCGASKDTLNLTDIIVAKDIYTLSNFGYNYNGYDKNIVYSSNDLNNKILSTASNNNLKVNFGTILTMDAFGPYCEDEDNMARVPKDLDILCEEMEAFALVFVANLFKKDASVIATVVDSKFTNGVLSVEDRERSLDNMITLALDSIIL